MSSANSAPRDESNRSRRRRRRGGPTVSRSEHDQQQPQHPPPSSFPRSSSRRPHTANRTAPNSHVAQTRSERDRSQRLIPVSPTSTTPPPSPPPRQTSAQIAREKEIREKEEREKEEREKEEREKEERKKEEREKEETEKELREKEAREEAQRFAQLAEQFARRSDERLKNLPFYIPLRPAEETNLSSTNPPQSQSQTSNSQLSSPPQHQTQPNQHSSPNQVAQLNQPNPAQSQARQQRPSDAELRQLDSSLKKCTGFIRKIRAMGVNEESVNSLCTEAHSLNLSRYISEVVAALAESKLRSGDAQYFVTLAGQLHRRYEEFLPELLTTLSSIVTAATPPARDLPGRKAAMRILVETFIVAMYADVNLITNILRQLMRTNSRNSKDDNLNSLSIISSFVRAATRVLIPPSTTPPTAGTISQAEKSSTDSSSQVAAEEQTSAVEVSEKHVDGNDIIKTSWEDDVVPTATKMSIQSALQTYFESEVSRMVKEASENLRKAGEAVARAKQVRDNPDDVTAAAFENAKQYCDKVISSANILAEALNKSTYSSPSDTPSSYEGSVVVDPTQVFVANPFSYVSKNRNATQDLDVMHSADHPFESDEQRMFYTELIEVESLVSTFKSTEKGGDKKAEGGDRSTAGSQREGKRKAAERTANMERLLNKLPGIESKDAADSFVQQFVLAKDSSRLGTKRLSKMLFTVSPQKLNVLPAYARIAASLQPLYGGEIGMTVSNCLQEDFRFYAGKAEVDEKTLALCIKCSHYIGEFVKFDIISITTMFDLLSLCMKDLSGHRIDAACHLLESCGRFVHRTFSSHIRMSSILETLWRVKSVRNLEARHNTLIENAFYAVKLSSGSKAQRVKARPPIHEYIRHLIYHRLDSANVTWTRNQLLKLPWDDELEFYVTKKFVKISRARYSTIPHVAALIFALHKHKLSLVISIVDLLLECIRSGMEKNDGRESQRRLAEAYLCGELYKCGVVSEQLLYNVLYQIITLGHDEARSNSPTTRQPNSPDLDPMLEDTGQSGRSPNGTVSNIAVPDPPGDFFRVRLVCVMLESCGRALVRSNRRAFEIFLAFLERYLFCKTYQAGLGDRVPLHIEYMLDDVLDGIIISNRRVVKDTRHSNRGETMYMNSSSGVEMPWQAALTRPFHRNRTFEDAIAAIYRIEQSHTDAALINMPVRHVAANNFPDSTLSGSLINTFNGIGHSQRSHAHKYDDKNMRNITRRSENGNRNALEDEEIEDVSSDGAMYGDDETLIADVDGLLSGDDAEVAGDHIFNGRDPHSNYEVDPGYNDEFDEADADFDPADEDDDNDNYDEDDEHEEDDDDVDDDDDDDVEDDVDIVLQSEDKARMEEEEAFAKELAAFTAEEVQNARASSTRVARLDRMVIPMSLMSKRLEEERAAEAALAVNGSGDSDDWSYDEHDDDEEGGGGDAGRDRRRKRVNEDPDAVEFKVLMRKGGKSQLTGLKVPATSSIAVAAKESETADIARHEETKRLVLGSSVVQNEEYDDFEDEIPMQVEIHAREKEESIRQQRITDEHELLATLYRNRPRR